MIVKAFKGKREVQITASAEEIAKMTGQGTVESMMKKHQKKGGMEGALKTAFPGMEIKYQRLP